MTLRAISVPVDPTTLVLLPQALMSDAYRLVVNEEGLDASTAANRMFRRMPWWIRALMVMRNGLVAPLGLKTGREKAMATSRKIGFFPIFTETPERVVLGLDDKHLDFRIAVDVAKLEGARRQITATTLVRSHNLLGRLYLAAVLPFHRVIVPTMLTQAGER
jgi:hypothetical protein